MTVYVVCTTVIDQIDAASEAEAIGALNRRVEAAGLDVFYDVDSATAFESEDQTFGIDVGDTVVFTRALDQPGAPPLWAVLAVNGDGTVKVKEAELGEAVVPRDWLTRV